jgi:hypothetical protein
MVEIHDVFRYLGVPILIRQFSKMKFNKEKIQKVRKIIVRISECGLKEIQVINEIKKRVLSRLDYAIMNSVISLMKLKKMDLLAKERDQLVNRWIALVEGYVLYLVEIWSVKIQKYARKVFNLQNQ